MLSCKLLSTKAAVIKHLYFLMEITYGEPGQNFVVWRAAKSHCLVAEFLLSIFCLIKFKASNTYKIALNIMYHNKERVI
jgi:hypothetical protein